MPFLLALLIPLLARANPSQDLGLANPSAIQTDFTAKASALPLEWERMGFTHFGTLPLRDYREKLPTVEAEIVGGSVFGLGPNGHYRTGAVNYRAGETPVWLRHRLKRPHVYLAPGALRAVFASQGLLEVLLQHEAMESLGYADENYEISFGMRVGLEMPPELRRNFSQSLGGEMTSPFVSGGGASGSGKGGDPLLLRFRDYFHRFVRQEIGRRSATPDEKEKLNYEFSGRFRRVRIEGEEARGGSLCDENRSFFEWKVGDPFSPPEVRVYRNEITMLVQGIIDRSCPEFVDGELRKLFAEVMAIPQP